MPKEQAKSKIDTHANEILQTKIDVSVGVARSIVQSWLPPLKPDEGEDEEPLDTLKSYSTGRPDRLGLGAKFLSHAEAMKLNNSTHSKEELQFKNKILNQNQRTAQRNSSHGNSPQKRKQQSQNDDDEEDVEEESRGSVGKIPASKKKIGSQGDFLSLFLTERKDKKKKKKSKGSPSA